MDNAFHIIQGSTIETIKKSITINGLAPYSGKKVGLTLKPANHGELIFHYNNSAIPASPTSIKLDPYVHTTLLKSNNCEIMSVEHLLSVLFTHQINSLDLELKGDNQIPYLDSSAKSLTKIVGKLQTKSLRPKRKTIIIDKPFEFKDEESRGFAYLTPCGTFTVNLEINFPNIIGQQRLEMKINKASFVKEICWARTFIRSPLDADGEKWSRIRKLIPILPEDPTMSPVIVFDDNHYLTPLRHPDEPLRHKLLDFLGDLSLLGVDMIGQITVSNPGHNFNQKLVLFLNKMVKNGGK